MCVTFTIKVYFSVNSKTGNFLSLPSNIFYLCLATVIKLCVHLFFDLFKHFVSVLPRRYYTFVGDYNDEQDILSCRSWRDSYLTK